MLGGMGTAIESVRFRARLLRSAQPRNATWTFLLLPRSASARLPSRGQVAVEGALAGHPFQAVLEPDGEGGHWLKVERKLREAAGVRAGDMVAVMLRPAAEEPEPRVPPDLRRALALHPQARVTWQGLTPAARRDWIHWITSGRKAETRPRRIAAACDMLAAGKRRVCCFDRSGMYSRSLRAPTPAPDPSP